MFSLFHVFPNFRCEPEARISPSTFGSSVSSLCIDSKRSSSPRLHGRRGHLLLGLGDLQLPETPHTFNTRGKMYYSRI